MNTTPKPASAGTANKAHANRDGLATALISVGSQQKGCEATRKGSLVGSRDLLCSTKPTLIHQTYANMSDIVQEKPFYKKGIAWAIGGVLLLIILVASNTSKPSSEVSNVPNENIVVDIPALLGKNWSEIKPAITPICDEETILMAERTKLLNCGIDHKYNFAFEIDEKGNVTDNNEFIFIGHTTYGATEDSVLSAANVDKNASTYRTKIKTDSAGQIIVTVSSK